MQNVDNEALLLEKKITEFLNATNFDAYDLQYTETKIAKIVGNASQEFKKLASELHLLVQRVEIAGAIYQVLPIIKELLREEGVTNQIQRIQELFVEDLKKHSSLIKLVDGHFLFNGSDQKLSFDDVFKEKIAYDNAPEAKVIIKDDVYTYQGY